MKDVRAQFGRRVRELRLASTATQEKLAERCGLSYKFIGEIERGQANPTLETMKQLANGLGIELHDLFVPSFQNQTEAVYRLRKRELQTVRDALRSADLLLDRLMPDGRKRSRRPSPP